MIGPVVLGGLLLYFLVSVAVVRGAARYAKTKGMNSKRWFWGAALVMYLIPFWDWIPTVVAHQYFCSSEAGFWVYKTPDKWKAENPGVLETLVSSPGQARTSVGDSYNSTRTSLINQRFAYVAKHNGPLFLNRWRYETEIIDQKNGEVMARTVDFSTSQERRFGEWTGWKFWINSQNCRSYAHLDEGSISEFVAQLRGKE